MLSCLLHLALTGVKLSLERKRLFDKQTNRTTNRGVSLILSLTYLTLVKDSLKSEAIPEESPQTDSTQFAERNLSQTKDNSLGFTFQPEKENP